MIDDLIVNVRYTAVNFWQFFFSVRNIFFCENRKFFSHTLFLILTYSSNNKTRLTTVLCRVKKLPCIIRLPAINGLFIQIQSL